jgi:Rod binding domain-containing protein
MTTGTLALTSSLVGEVIDPAKPISKSNRDTPEAIKKAATEFEALLIGEVLKTSREADGSGWMGTDGEEAGSTLSELSEQQISQSLAKGGGFGLAKMISTGLKTASSAPVR